MEGNVLANLLPFIVLIAIFYFLIIAPNVRQQKAHKAMLDNLKKGDKIVTNGGLVGQIVSVEDNFIKVELNDKVIVKIVKEYVAKKLDENKE
jgi:preprotein translocase subunit YajC